MLLVIELYFTQHGSEAESMAFRRNMDVSADHPKNCRTFPVNSTHCGLGCFSWNTLCCYLHEEMLIMRLITGPAASQSSRQLISLSSSCRRVVLNLLCSQFGKQRRKVNQGYLLFLFNLNLANLRQRGAEGCTLGFITMEKKY